MKKAIIGLTLLASIILLYWFFWPTLKGEGRYCNDHVINNKVSCQDFEIYKNLRTEKACIRFGKEWSQHPFSSKGYCFVED